MYELVIVWADGEPKKQIFDYHSEEAAEDGGKSMKMACGDQIEWYGVRRKNDAQSRA